jgi:hypothetical protein
MTATQSNPDVRERLFWLTGKAIEEADAEVLEFVQAGLEENHETEPTNRCKECGRYLKKKGFTS